MSHLKNARKGSKSLLLRRERQRLAVLLAVVIEVALVALQDRPRDVLRPSEAALVAPADEAQRRCAARAVFVCSV